MKKTKYIYRNTTFYYVAYDGSITWYSDTDEYLGYTDNSVSSSHAFLDNYIK